MATQHAENTGNFSFESRDNLGLLAWADAPWEATPDLKRRVDAFRDANPTGSALFNLITVGEPPSTRIAWTRMGAGFLPAGAEPGRSPIHFGTAHLFAATGLRAAPARVLFRFLERRGGDFARHHNVIVRSIDDATDWLLGRLSNGPVPWSRRALRETIERFCQG